MFESFQGKHKFNATLWIAKNAQKKLLEIMLLHDNNFCFRLFFSIPFFPLDRFRTILIWLNSLIWRLPTGEKSLYACVCILRVRVT